MISNGVRLRIKVTGVVQGVGFRPFIYTLAQRCGLLGFVCNTFDGAEMEIQGEHALVQQFLLSLRNELPPIARIDSLNSETISLQAEHEFRIVQSEGTGGQAALISPDVAICDACSSELFDPSNRRYRYPFINCTHCGPRFTIVEQVPYDRPKTTMRVFPMCSECAQEYRDPNDRRYHAQPVACPACGPNVRLLTASGDVIATKDQAILLASQAIAEGKIVAIKGLGGFHLACDATCESAVAQLRLRKNRPRKPLAVMCSSLESARAWCQISEHEARELAHPRHPILLLRRKTTLAPGATPLACSLAPGLLELGVMLPYTPLHKLLMDQGSGCWVMTSGNPTNAPIAHQNDDARGRLSHIADLFLEHDRDIWNRCDDSVGYLVDQRLVLTRRSRGFTPLPVRLPKSVPPILATGASMISTFAIANNDRAFLSQHIGDVDTEETLSFLQESAEKLASWLQLDPGVIAHDLHPDLLTTRWAKELSSTKRTLAVQHHHAHLASALAAAGIEEDAIGLVFDGTGYGPDGTIWGGEILEGSSAKAVRTGYLRQLPLPGGDAAIRRPLRTAIAYLHALCPESESWPLPIWNRADSGELQVVRRMVERRFHTPMTSSMGRLFDAVSALLGVADSVSYEGQAAIELEHLARQGRVLSHVPWIEVRQLGQILQLDPEPTIRMLARELMDRTPIADLAMSFHEAVAQASAQVIRLRTSHRAPRRVVLCGGVFQNRILVERISALVQTDHVELVLPSEIPINDGGLALGQIMVAAAMLEGRGELCWTTLAHSGG